MFGDELIIGSIRAQANRIRQVVDQIEADENWKAHCAYYVNEMHEVEKSLRRIRKIDLELVYSGSQTH